MKIAVIGNSHLASLKRAWDQMDTMWPRFDLTFFGMRAHGLWDLQSQSSQLVAGSADLRAAFTFTSGGQDHIETTAYDAFVLYGMWAPAIFWDPARFYSRKVTDQALKDSVEKTMSFFVLNQLRKTCDTPAYLGHDPLPSSQDDRAECPVEHYTAGIDLLNSRLLNPMGASMLRQPAQTIVKGNQTLAEYTSGATRLAIGDEMDHQPHPLEDPYSHMNAAFGALWLEQALDVIASKKNPEAVDTASGFSLLNWRHFFF